MCIQMGNLERQSFWFHSIFLDEVASQHFKVRRKGKLPKFKYWLKTFGHSLQIILFIQPCHIPDHLEYRNAHYLVCHKDILASVCFYCIGLVVICGAKI